MSWIVDHSAILIVIGAILLVHFFFAYQQSADVKWVPNMSRVEAISWYLFIWLVPIIGVLIAREHFNLPKQKRGSYRDGAMDYYDD